jgi:hypothetical protein
VITELAGEEGYPEPVAYWQVIPEPPCILIKTLQVENPNPRGIDLYPELIDVQLNHVHIENPATVENVPVSEYTKLLALVTPGAFWPTISFRIIKL